MTCTQEELELQDKFENYYKLSQESAVLSIESRVCGCRYGASGWTTRNQADDLIANLKLQAGVRLLDLGSGSGWPALYLAEKSECEAVLVDSSETGLSVAAERIRSDGMSATVSTVVADATDLPFAEGSFDAINHSDLLCCLARKKLMLEGCRKVIQPDGQMAFTVIFAEPNLSSKQCDRAKEFGPAFIEVGVNYPTLLTQTGWVITKQVDLTKTYAVSTQKLIKEFEARESDLVNVLGREEYKESLAGWQGEYDNVRDGITRRELFVAVPEAPADRSPPVKPYYS